MERQKSRLPSPILMKDPIAKAAYDKARRLALRVDKRPTTCKLCGTAITQAATSVRIYCDAGCRQTAFYRRHGYPKVTPLEPMPMPYVGHAIFDQASKAANLTSSSYSVDWGQNDVLGEAVLAIVEGRDPKRAARAARAVMKANDMRRAWNVLDFGADADGTIYAVRDYEGD